MVSSFAAKAARKANQDYKYRTSNVVSSSSTVENKENQQQLDKVVESVANATKRLSQASATTTNSSKRKSQNHVGPWRLGRTLGRGSTGRVRLLKHSITGQLAAVKIVPKLSPDNPSNNKKLKNNIKIDKNGLPYGIEREIIIMKVISHPNIMALYDVWENKNELYLVLEYIEGGELFDYLVRKGKLEEKEAVTYFRQIISGLQYCHKFNICHRDLKPENLLLDKYRKIKIADFGMATLETNSNLLETSCGSPHYASPEIVAGKNYHGGPSDIWSAGIILFALLTGRLPFDDPNIRELLLKVQTGKFRMPTSLSPEAKDLIWKMLKVDPRQRISIDDILRHPLLTKYCSNKNKIANNDFSKIDNLDLSPIYQYNDEILKNLQTLWHDVDVNTLKLKLSSPERNSEKIFYQLLKNHLEDHLANNKPPQDLKKTLPRSTSIVTTTITDANGANIKTITRQVPNIPAPQLPTTNSSPQRKPLGNLNLNQVNQAATKKTKTLDGKKQVISASSSYRKSKSFKNHKKNRSISRSSSKRSIRSPLSSKNISNKQHPPLPEVRESRLNVMDFMYLCDEIFGKDVDEMATSSSSSAIGTDETLLSDELERKLKADQLKEEFKMRQQELILAKEKLKQLRLAREEAQQQKLLAEKQLKAREELRQLEILKAKERDNFISSYPKIKIAKNVQMSSLDPHRRITEDRRGNAKDVLNKIGVRLSRFGNLRDLEFPPPPPATMRAVSQRSSLIESKSVSTRDLKSYLKDESKKNITIEEFNKYKEHHLEVPKTHKVKPSEDISFDFSINEVERMPISPVDNLTFNEPRFYSIDKKQKKESVNIEDRYLDADTSLSSVNDDEELIRILNAFSEMSSETVPEKYESKVEDKGSFIVHHRKADSRDDDNSSFYSTKIGQPIIKTTNLRSSLFNNNNKEISRDNTQDLISRFNLTPDKPKRNTNLKNLIIDNELLLRKQEQEQKKNKFLRLSIYEDPDDDENVVAAAAASPSETTITTTEENIQELDVDDDSFEIEKELVDMNLYENKKNLMSKFVTKPLLDGNLSPIIEINNEDLKTPTIELSKKRSVKIKNFFNGESRRERKKFLKPIRQAPRLPSYNTYNFNDVIENKKQKKKKISSDLFRKLLHFF